MTTQEYIKEILSETTEVNSTLQQVKAFSDDKGNEFAMAFYDEDGFLSSVDVLLPNDTKSVYGEEAEQIVADIEARIVEL